MYKAIAARVADVWLHHGYDKALEAYQASIDEHKLVLWETLALKDAIRSEYTARNLKGK